MCNAYNHPPGCTCGWGGEGYAGHSNGGGGLSVSPPDFSRGGGIKKRSATTHRIKCWWCKEPVFYHSNGYGDTVLFDELGFPWQIHACWDLHSEARSERATKFARLLDHIAKDTQQPESPWPEYVIELEATEKNRGKVIVVVGFISSIARGAGKYIDLLDPIDGGAQWDLVRIVGADNTGFPIWIPSKVAAYFIGGQIVNVSRRHILTHGDWQLVGVRSQSLNYPQTSGDVIRLARIGRSARCQYCGISQIHKNQGWWIDHSLCIECERCHEFRGDRSPRDFRAMCELISSHGRRGVQT